MKVLPLKATLSSKKLAYSATLYFDLLAWKRARQATAVTIFPRLGTRDSVRLRAGRAEYANFPPSKYLNSIAVQVPHRREPREAQRQFGLCYHEPLTAFSQPFPALIEGTEL